MFMRFSMMKSIFLSKLIIGFFCKIFDFLNIFYRNVFYYPSDNENKKNADNLDVKLYEDFIERALIVEKNSFLNDLDNIKTYFLKQVTYNPKGVNKFKHFLKKFLIKNFQ